MRARRIGTRRWLPSRRLARRSRGLVLGGVWLRFATWRRAYDLDRELAGGADPMRIDELALRVGQLGSTRSRARLACALRGAVELADRPPDPLRLPATRIQCSEVRANRELLLELAECLGTDRPLGVEGLAMTSLLVHYARSPLYNKDASRSLTGSACEALVALERGSPSATTPTGNRGRSGLGGRCARNGYPAQWPQPGADGMLGW